VVPRSFKRLFPVEALYRQTLACAHARIGTSALRLTQHNHTQPFSLQTHPRSPLTVSFSLKTPLHALHVLTRPAHHRKPCFQASIAHTTTRTYIIQVKSLKLCTAFPRLPHTTTLPPILSQSLQSCLRSLSVQFSRPVSTPSSLPPLMQPRRLVSAVFRARGRRGPGQP